MVKQVTYLICAFYSLVQARDLYLLFKKYAKIKKAAHEALLDSNRRLRQTRFFSP